MEQRYFTKEFTADLEFEKIKRNVNIAKYPLIKMGKNIIFNEFFININKSLFVSAEIRISHDKCYYSNSLLSIGNDLGFKINFSPTNDIENKLNLHIDMYYNLPIFLTVYHKEKDPPIINVKYTRVPDNIVLDTDGYVHIDECKQINYSNWEYINNTCNIL